MNRARRLAGQPPDDWERATPVTLRHMAETERAVAATLTRWAAEHRRLAVAYDDLADAKDARRREEG